VDHDRVPVAGEAEQRCELGPLRVLARSVIGEEAVDDEAVELAIRVLLEAADPDVAEALAGHRLPSTKCQGRLYDLPSTVSRNALDDPNLTLLRAAA
jgi:hypothetical protein